LIIYPLLCCEEIGKDPYFDFFRSCVGRILDDNLTKVIMEALMIGEGLPKKNKNSKFINFGVDGANVCQSTKLGVTKQIWDDYVPHSMGIHYNPLHKSSNANLIYTSFGEALGEFVIDLKCLFCTFM
jgi:hypothetical protein